MSYVYIITHTETPNKYKVGFTDRSPEDRARELSNTGFPTGYYKVVYKREFHTERTASLVEKGTHKILKEYNIGREWFQCSPDYIVHCIDEAYEELPEHIKQLNENYIRKKHLSQQERDRLEQLEQERRRQFYTHKKNLDDNYERTRDKLKRDYELLGLEEKGNKYSFKENYLGSCVVAGILGAMGKNPSIGSILFIAITGGLFITMMLIAFGNKDHRNSEEYKKYISDSEQLKKRYDKDIQELRMRYKDVINY